MCYGKIIRLDKGDCKKTWYGEMYTIPIQGGQLKKSTIIVILETVKFTETLKKVMLCFYPVLEICNQNDFNGRNFSAWRPN